jgi:hypothetical protein
MGFVHKMREKAAKMGYLLTWDKLEKRSSTIVEVFGVDALRFVEKDDRPEGELVDLQSEEDIFRFLKMKYVHPSERVGH